MKETNHSAASKAAGKDGQRKATIRKIALIIVAAGILVVSQIHERRQEAARNQVSRESAEATAGADEDVLGGRPGTVIEMTTGRTSRRVILPTEDAQVIKAVRDQVRDEYEGPAKTVASEARGEQ